MPALFYDWAGSRPAPASAKYNNQNKKEVKAGRDKGEINIPEVNKIPRKGGLQGESFPERI